MVRTDVIAGVRVMVMVRVRLRVGPEVVAETMPTRTPKAEHTDGIVGSCRNSAAHTACFWYAVCGALCAVRCVLCDVPYTLYPIPRPYDGQYPIPLYPYTPIPVNPYTPIPVYPYTTPIPLYPYTSIPLYPYTPMPLYPYTL